MKDAISIIDYFWNQNLVQDITLSIETMILETNVQSIKRKTQSTIHNA